MNYIFRRHIQTLLTTFAFLLTICAMNATQLSAATAPRTQKGSSKGEHEFTVVIDAGHGGHDYGAVDNGANEKDINLNVAKKFASLIKKKMKDVKIVMTRDDDTFISLQERANIANRNKGDLFISIHTNSVDKSNPNRKSVSGASVYALGPQKDANNLKVAQRENSVIELEDNFHQKYSGFDPSKDESYIIFEMAQKKNLGQSLKFADKAQKELVATAGRKDRGVKQAGFWVLWATSMPSVLVELDFICNPDEAEFLDSTEGQDKLATALCNALEQYIATYRKPIAEQPAEKSLHNQQAGADLKKADDTQGKAVLQASQTTDGVNTLVAATPKTEKTRAPKYQPATGGKTTTTPRRRRSDSSKTISDNRSLETDNIILKSENQFLATQESVKEEETPAAQESSAADKSKKAKNNKKKKEKSSTSKTSKPKEEKPKQNSGYKKTYTIASTPTAKPKTNATETQTALSALAKQKTEQKAALQETASKSQESKMTYKIQLLASDYEKAFDDPSFCGLTPSGMFKENGKFKYTYGSSTSRREIEQKLLEIKPLIPDATIIVTIE